MNSEFLKLHELALENLEKLFVEESKKLEAVKAEKRESDAAFKKRMQPHKDACNLMMDEMKSRDKKTKAG